MCLGQAKNCVRWSLGISRLLLTTDDECEVILCCARPVFYVFYACSVHLVLRM